ncbi:hypothetical protein TNCV_1907991 [Trichonephila clavipes]|nr:hypothetical protein TNCV_1907991 [Trichonephila clavipes]
MAVVCEGLLTSHYSAARGVLVTTNLVILNHAQVKRTIPKLAPSNLSYRTTPTGGLCFDKFNVHQSVTWWVFSEIRARAHDTQVTRPWSLPRDDRNYTQLPNGLDIEILVDDILVASSSPDFFIRFVVWKYCSRSGYRSTKFFTKVPVKSRPRHLIVFKNLKTFWQSLQNFLSNRSRQPKAFPATTEVVFHVFF